MEAFLGLALKAQAQSWATVSALVDLKYPRQATFVKQANIANGPQQVNNGAAGVIPEQYAQARTHAGKCAPEQNKLLEANHGQPGKGWTPERRKRQSEAIIRGWQPWQQSTGPKSPEGRAVVARNAWRGGEWLKLREAVKGLNKALKHQINYLA